MKSGIVYTSVLIALSALLSTPTYGQCHKHQLHLLSGTLSTSASRQTGSGLFANTDTHTHTQNGGQRHYFPSHFPAITRFFLGRVTRKPKNKEDITFSSAYLPRIAAPSASNAKRSLSTRTAFTPRVSRPRVCSSCRNSTTFSLAGSISTHLGKL